MAQIRPLKLDITQRAATQLVAIQEYISQDNPYAAYGVGSKIRATFEMLRDFPAAGRSGREFGTREWSVRGLPYIVVYGVTDASVVIFGVFHGAQNR